MHWWFLGRADRLADGLATVACQQHHDGKYAQPRWTGTAPRIVTFANRNFSGGPDHGCDTRHLDRSVVRGIAERSRGLLEQVLGAEPVGDATWELRGERRGGTITYDEAPAEPGRQSAGTVHHVAWGTSQADHPKWHERVQLLGIPNSGIIDRHYFHSIYFREPSGVLFELADDGPGFTVDVPLDQLGSVVILPPRFEQHRAEIEKRLTPLPDPRAGWATTRSWA